MLFDQMIDTAIAHSKAPTTVPPLQVTDDWTQGRTVFGGLSAAMALAALRDKVSKDRLLRVFSCNFVGPLLAGKPFSLETETLRQGKNVSQLSARIIQDEQVCLVCEAAFGVARASKVKVQSTDTHNMMPPDKANFIPPIPKIVPKFIRHFDLAFDDGGLPFTGSKKNHTHGWMRHKLPSMQINEAHLVAMIDAWPPTVLQMIRWPAPASTMCWNIEFIHPHPSFQPSDWFAYQAQTRQSNQGYSHIESNVWDQSGNLIALSRQAVTVFA